MVSATVSTPRPGILGLGATLRERAHGIVRAAVTPLEPDDVLDLFAPLRRGAELRGRIVSVEPEAVDAATIVIKPGKDWAGHTPGQFVRIGIEVDGVRHWRAYSLTHGPRRDGHISVTVKAVAGGRVSPYLVHHAKPGTLVHLEQAAGEFVLAEQPGKLLFVTAGSGITPVIGMLRNLFPATDGGVLRLPRSRALDIVVLHVAPTRAHSIFISNLEELAEAGVLRLIDRYDDVDGLLEVDRLAELVPDLTERTTYACGPHGLLDALQEHHDALGVTLFTEQFRVGRLEEGGEHAGGSVDIAGRLLELDGATTILDAAEDAGVLMPSGCRMGICMSCVLPMTSGAVRDLRNGQMTVAVAGETPPGGIKIQTCISAAAGPCVIEHEGASR